MTTKPMSRPMPSYLLDRGYKVWNYAEEPLIRQPTSILNHNNNNQSSYSHNTHTNHSHTDNRKDLGKLIEETVPEEVNEIRRNGFNLSNPYLNTLEVDKLYHLGLIKKGDNLAKKFGDVKFVCTGESVSRMELTATILKRQLNLTEPIEKINQDVDRFTIYKVGPILCVNHGIGVPSLTILLNEIFKLLAYARCQNVTIFRLGTCGSIGKPPGALIITNKVVDDRQRPLFEQVVLGRVVSLEATVDQELVEELRTIGGTQLSELTIETGTTMATNDFYEGQGRMNGAFCAHTFAERGRHLLSLKKAGIINIEMEANAFFALCTKAKLKCACVDVVICDRLRGDMSNIDSDQFSLFEQRPALLIAKYIQRHMDLN